MAADSPALQTLLRRIFPEIEISGIAKPSGQRVVYFCKFSKPLISTVSDPLSTDWSKWGDVVLKVSSGVDPTSVAYMQMEIAILNSLDSPYYPKLHYYELFTDDPDTEEKLPEHLFVTIENRVDAEPLSACKSRFSTEPQLIELLLKLVDALVLLWEHERKLVHRDLKPDNILISTSNEVTIIDLGIVREAGTKGITATHAIHGPLSPQYASPEQATNDKKNISFKSDVFALATIVHELMAGENPFMTRPGISMHEILSNVINYVPARLDKIARCSESFGSVIEKMMHKEPYRRYRTAALLRADLENIRRDLS